MSAGKSSAVADIAAQAGPDQGRLMAHTRSDAAADGDLFRQAVLDEELDGFASATVRPPVKRGAGRPPGSVNRTTLQLQKLLLARGYRDPAEFTASIYTMDTIEMASLLRPDRNPANVTFDQAQAALALQLRAAEATMPYFHQKMPIAIQHSGDGQRPLIMINDLGAMASVQARSGEASGMSVHDAEIVQQSQGVEAKPAASSHDGKAGDNG